ncbi:MAG: hypothetical protein VX562_03290 [Pseudomonadota bacterium]|nr:hypothetical protein [Pseudomonadota bacterium]|tara:strand:- start:962 stop:1129 length:168 start_codon:yes stop_codon:yes gene_type:complete
MISDELAFVVILLLSNCAVYYFAHAAAMNDLMDFLTKIRISQIVKYKEDDNEKRL